MPKNMTTESLMGGQAITEQQNTEIRLGFLIHDTARLRRIVIDEKFKPLNITRSQAWLMAYLSRSEGLAQTALADQMGLGKVALGCLIDRLEASAMIERRVDPSDRRMNNIFLTDKGRQVTADMRKLTLTANDDLLDGISATELNTAVKVLDRLKHNLEEIKNEIKAKK